MTGVSLITTELDPKRLSLLAEYVPSAKRIAILRDRAVPANHTPELEATARTLGLTLDVVEVERPDDIGPAINLAKSRGAEALNVLASPMLNGSASNVAASAREAGLPACVSGVKWQRRVVLSAMGLPSWKGIASPLRRWIASFEEQIQPSCRYNSRRGSSLSSTLQLLELLDWT